MKNRMCIILYFFIFICSFGYEGENFKKLQGKIFENEVNVSGITVENFLIFLSEESGVTLISSEDIKNSEVYLYMDKNKNFLDILDVFCSSKEYVMKDRGNHILISKRENTEENRGVLLGEVFSSEHNERLKGVKISLLDDYSKPCYTTKDGIFRINNIPYGSYFIKGEKDGYEVVGEIIDINKKQNRIKLLLEKNYQLENREDNTSENFIIKKIKVGDLENIKIEEILPDMVKNQVKLTRDNKKDILYISGIEKNVKETEKIVEEICHSNKGIRIAVQILDITDNLFQELGSSWIYGRGNPFDKTGLVGGILDNSYTQGVGSIFNSTFNYIKNFGSEDSYLNFGINLLKTNQDLKISTTSSIVTTNGKEGELKVTREQIVGQERVENIENSQNTYLPIFREAGTVFKVLPEIIDEEHTALKVTVESSDFKNLNGQNVSEDSENENIGNKVSRNLETSLKVRNGETVFIGGLKMDIEQNQQSKLPFIGDIPGIGALFRNTKKGKEATELYIRMRVDVVENSGFKDFDVKNFEKID